MTVPGRERGFALLLVLWTMALLSLLATHIASSARGEAQLAANVRDAAITQSAADGAIAEAGFHLLDAPGRQWRADDAPHVVQMPGVAIEIRVRSEEGKVNPNLASADLLAALLRGVGASNDAAQLDASAISAWRFPGAQANLDIVRAYRAAGRDYLPSGKRLRDLDELGAVLGMTPELTGRLGPYLTFYYTGAPDPTQASPVVLQALRTARESVGVPALPTVVAVTAAAVGPNGSRFVRRAILRLIRDGDGAPAARVLEWNASPS